MAKPGPRDSFQSSRSVLRPVVLAVLVSMPGLATSAFGQGAQNIIKQRAKDVRDQSNARQGVPPPGVASKPVQPTAAAQPVQQSASPAFNAPQAATATEKKLDAELAAIQPGAVSEATRQNLANTLQSLAQTPKPSEATISKLAAELANGFAEKPLSASRRARLASTLNSILNGRKQSAAQLKEYVSDVQFLFQAEGLPKEKAVLIGEAARNVAGETGTR